MLLHLVPSQCSFYILSPSAYSYASLSCLPVDIAQPPKLRRLCRLLAGSCQAVMATITPLRFLLNMKATRVVPVNLLSSRHPPPCHLLLEATLSLSQILHVRAQVVNSSTSALWNPKQRTQVSHAGFLICSHYEKISIVLNC